MAKSVLSCPVSDGDDMKDDMKSVAPSAEAAEGATHPLSDVARKEEETLAQWQTNHIFEKTLAQTKNGEPFVFYDGPPFATGLPHYGHLLAGTMKDTIPRYQTMCGRHVRRVWGWDCHGLPVEVLVEKKLGLNNKKDIIEYGIDTFNERARASVMMYDNEWKHVVPRMGRFVDMNHAYKTMDASYSTSVWWAFKTLNDNGLVYKGYRSMHICPRCQTTLSNNEVSEGYKNVKDLSVITKFKVKSPEKYGLQENTYILAWTTTPWTLQGNVALAVGKGINYVVVEMLETDINEVVKVKNIGETNPIPHVSLYTVRFIVAKERVEELFAQHKQLDGNYVIKSELKGEDLVGMEYEPLFPYYANDENLEHRENGWKIYVGDFVTTDEGTGIVHIAPAFGADDLVLAQTYDLPFIQHVGIDGVMKPEVTDFAGMEVKPNTTDEKERLATDIAVIKYLQDHGTFFAKEKYEHAYPHCWRCDTPLLNYATDAWFVNVQKLKDRASQENKNIGWTPGAIGHARFANLIENAPDWNISRQRFWGAPLPVWESATGERIVIGSAEELKAHTKRSGNTYAVMRHGEGDHNVLGIFSSKNDNPHHVTEKGKEQIAASIEAMRADGFIPDIIVASPLIRTQETAMQVANAFGISPDAIVTDEYIRETNVGVFEGKPITSDDTYFENTRAWLATSRPEGESQIETKRRMTEALYAYEQKYTDKRILFVTHDSPARMLVAGAQGKTLDELVAQCEGKKEDFLSTGTYRRFDFVPLPHNADYELDVHRPYIDDVVLVKEGVEYRRVVDVFDCWFESGSMPFGQFGYPAHNEDLFTANFPADFIAEGLDQTRGWFYSLLMLGVGLFDKAPYKHVIVNGLILAEDGKKMSKKLKNYPDPMDIASRYGADALRMYLLGSPAVRGEELRFSERGVDEVYKKTIARLENVVSFYALYSHQDVRSSDATPSAHVLDKWIVSRIAEVRNEVTKSLDAYELDRAVRPFVDFVDDLSTWYVRRSRERMKDDGGDAPAALATLRTVLRETAILLAPIAPFLAERMYVGARGEMLSVHLETWPAEGSVDADVLADMVAVRAIVSQALEARKREGVKVRQPLATLFVADDGVFVKNSQLAEITKDELNVKAIVANKEKAGDGVAYDMTITPELRREGQMREFLRAVQDARKAKGLSPDDMATLAIQDSVDVRAIVEKYKETIMKTALLNDVVFVLSLASGIFAHLGDEVEVIFVVEKK